MNMDMNKGLPSARTGGESESSQHSLAHIRTAYLLCKPLLKSQTLSELIKPLPGASLEKLRLLYETTIGHPNQEHQPPIQYRIGFLKHVIKQLESLFSESASNDKSDEDEEISSLWYQALESVSGEGTQSEPFYRWYELSGEGCSPVKMYENEGAFVAEGTTGLVTWEASIELAKYFCLNSPTNEEVKKRKWVIELGSGCGLLAIATLKTFSHLSKYIASDGHSSAIRKCKINLEANFGTLKTDVIQVVEIDWEKDREKFEEVVRKLSEDLGPGVLLGADIVFDPDLIPPLGRLIEAFLACHQDSIVFLSCTLRNEETLDLLQTTLRKAPNTVLREMDRWGNNSGIIYTLSPAQYL